MAADLEMAVTEETTVDDEEIARDRLIEVATEMEVVIGIMENRAMPAEEMKSIATKAFLADQLRPILPEACLQTGTF